MPIRINLKEIFPSDPQEISSEKLNFNFNKLLELGIGTAGPIGLTGPIGPPGPIGLTGTQGIRGATWWVDSNDPNTHTFVGLLDGDLYLDNVNFDVWQWDSATSIWVLEVSLSTIISNYLSLNGSPFVKNLGLGTTTEDPRFITFLQRAAGNDSSRGATNFSSNNSLFLTNFDETNTAFDLPLDPSFSPNTLYNSLISIFPNHSDSQSSVNASLGRYHIELGSLYNNGTNVLLSNIKHNLKVKFFKEYRSTPILSSTNTWINTAQFSLSIPEPFILGDIDQNGVFNFITPKVNKQDPDPTIIVRDELTMHIGSAEAHVELPNLAHVVTDGISFALTSSGIGANIGLAYNYDSTYTRLDGRELFMLDSNAGVTGVLIKDDTYVIGNTNVIGKISIGDIDPTSDLTISGNASIGSGYDTINAPTNGAIIEGTVGIGTSSPDPAVNLHVFGKTKMSDSLEVDGSHTTHSSVFSKTRTLNTKFVYFGPGPPPSPFTPPSIQGTDHIVFMTADVALSDTSETIFGIRLPSAFLNTGRSICLQLISNTGSPALFVYSYNPGGGIAGDTINQYSGSYGDGYPFPSTLYTKRTFISDGTNWYTEP
jgi:hypothetical protein